MNKRQFTIVASIVVLLLGGATALYFSGSSPASSDQPATQPASPSDMNQQARASLEGARALKTEMNQTLDGERVFVTRHGEVVVAYASDAQMGNQLQTEMRDIAHVYAETAYEHQEMGGLNVRANGVTLMVSKDAAVAHANGTINQDAFNQTFHWDSIQQEGN